MQWRSYSYANFIDIFKRNEHQMIKYPRHSYHIGNSPTYTLYQCPIQFILFILLKPNK